MTKPTSTYERFGGSAKLHSGARRTKHFTDPAAGAVWAAILTLDEGAQHQVLRHLRERLAVPTDRKGHQGVREARALAALCEAAEVLEQEAQDRGDPIPLAEVKVSEREYEQLRSEHPERGWPEPRRVALWLGGSWNEALARAGLHPSDDPDTGWRQESRGVSFEDTTQAICGAFAAKREVYPEASEISCSEVLAWTRRPDVRARPGRRPESESPFHQHGGYAACHEAALGTKAPSKRRVASPRPLKRFFSYTDVQIHDTLRALAVELGHSPRARDYMKARRDALERDAAEGRPPRPFVSYQTIQSRYGDFNAALADAGLKEVNKPTVDPMTGRSLEPQLPNRMTYEEIVQALRDAYAAKGKPFTTRAYEAYRYENERRAADGRRLPAYACIYERFRDVSTTPWRQACDVALPEGWNQ